VADLIGDGKRKEKKAMKKTLFLLFAAATLFVAVPSFAQSQVCVHNHSGYRARFQVAGTSGSSKWSEDFNSTQWRCVALDDLVAKDGESFTVSVSPHGGSAITCEGGVKVRVAKYPGSITYIAWGGFLTPGCKPPGD
jgi:hypothetical protein